MTSVAVQCDLQPGSFAISWPMGKWVVEWLAKPNSMAIWAVFISYELGRIFFNQLCLFQPSFTRINVFIFFFLNLGDVQEMAARLLQLEQENAKVIVRSCCAWSEILTPKIKYLS